MRFSSRYRWVRLAQVGVFSIVLIAAATLVAVLAVLWNLIKLLFYVGWGATVETFSKIRQLIEVNK
jgi:hypothetical protein